MGLEEAENQYISGTSTHYGQRIFFCRVPGLLAYAAKCSRTTGSDPAAFPLIVAEGRLVRDACPVAQARGVRTDSSVMQARRLCPLALVIPLQALNAERYTAAFLDRLADFSPVVEPAGPDAAFAADVLAGGESDRDVAGFLSAWATSVFGLPPLIGFGPCRVAARACAECNLSTERLSEADVAYLWPEDPQIPARLKRLGLPTFGAVADLSESVLTFYFGRIGRLLHRRAHGIDLTPVRALYPPLRADVRCDLTEHPVSDSLRLDIVLKRLSERAEGDLRRLNRHGRRIVLRLEIESGSEIGRERVLPIPLRDASELLRVARSLLKGMRLSAPVTQVRLLVDDTDLPSAQTLSLFPSKKEQHEVSLTATKRHLHTRFGVQSLRRLGELPLPLRDERRVLMREAAGAAAAAKEAETAKRR